MNINAFAGTFAFLPTLVSIPKKQKSLQANAQRYCKMDRQYHDRKRRAAGNSGFASCGVTVVISSAVFQFNFSAGLTVLCYEIPHERKAAKRYQQA